MKSTASPEFRIDRFVATILALLVFIAGLLLDALMIQWGLPRADALVVSNLLTGGVAGVAYWILMIQESKRRAAAMRHIQVIAEMNHHVRNALQVIVYYCSQMEQQPRDEMQHAVERIKWSLTAILPQIDSGEPVGQTAPAASRLDRDGDRA